VHFDANTVRLHWATTALIVILWILGQTADLISEGRINRAYWSVHVVFGFVLTILVGWRIIWRGAYGSRLPPADFGLLQVAAKATHYILYLLLSGVLALGVVNAFVRGYNLFDIISLPRIGDKALRKPITNWYGFMANILLGLAFLHACAALTHHFLTRDNVPRRMLPRRGN
jgi:cytochrome b561